jgi:hypothetical protein
MSEPKSAVLVGAEIEEGRDFRPLDDERVLATPVGFEVDKLISASPPRDRRSRFLSRLHRMSEAERVLAGCTEFSLWELNVWTSHFPDEVPRINGEFQWIAATLADNE